MPYSANSTPAYVPESIRASWAAQWNAVYAKSIAEGKDKDAAEELAFGVANKTIQKEREKVADGEATIGRSDGVKVSYESVFDPIAHPPMNSNPDRPGFTTEMLSGNSLPSNATTNDRKRDEPARPAIPQDSNPEADAPKDPIEIAGDEFRVDAATAGYLELVGAHKDADCVIVRVEGGISSKRGCCNLYEAAAKADEFRCGECKFVTALKADKKATLDSVGSTLDNLQHAHEDECNAHAKYLAFAQKAKEEGHTDIAGTLASIATEEASHRDNHAGAIRALGAKPKVGTKAPEVGTTEANLLAALDKGETKERDVTYPAFIAAAREEKNEQAAQSFQNALKDETKHASLLQSALDNLRANKAKGITAPIKKGEKQVKLSAGVLGMPFTVLLSMAAPTTAWNGKDVQDIPLACTGSWVKGEPFSITEQDLQSIVDNFKKRKNEQVVIDYEHASEHPVLAKGQPIPAAGWIHDVYTRGNQLIGRVEWTPQASDMVRTGQYRFFSPAIDWGVKDKGSGEPQGATLTSGALTNHPFLEELPPILLSEEELISVGTAHIPAALGKGAPQSVTADSTPLGTTPPEAAPALKTADTSDPPLDTAVPVADGANPVVSAAETLDKSQPPVKKPEFCDPSQPPAGPQGEQPPVAPQAAVSANASEECMAVLADKKPYGDVAYADPGYQKDKQKRYPVDTEEHIRAAWNYIHKSKNAAKYSGDQVSQIRSRIVSAWKSKIDKSGPPSAQAASEIPMKSQVKKIEDGKFKGRFGRFDELGEMLCVMPKGMSDQAMAEFCAELDDADPVAGNAQAGPTHPVKDPAEQEPAGAFLQDKTDPPTETPDEPEPPKKVKASDQELSPTEILRLISYPEGSKKAGRINLSEVPRLVDEGRIEPSVVFKAQAAEQAVDEAIQGGKFLPKQRPHLMRQAMTDLAGFGEFVASTPKQVALSSVIGLGSESEGPDPVVEVDKAARKELTEHKEDPKYTYSDALADATRKQPKLWEDYRDATIAPAREMLDQ